MKPKLLTAFCLLLITVFSCFHPAIAGAVTPTGGAPAKITLVEPAAADNLQKLQETNACVGCDFNGISLKDLNLSWANLEGANLSQTDLERTNLQGANLKGTNLQGADLGKTLLAGADLSGANLLGADLEKANLQGANLTNANLQKADLEKANLTNARLDGANLQDADGEDGEGAEMLLDFKKAHQQDLKAIAEILARISHQSPEKVEILLETMLKQLIEPKTPFYETATPTERAQAFRDWASSHDRGSALLSDYAVSRDSIFDILTAVNGR